MRAQSQQGQERITSRDLEKVSNNPEDMEDKKYEGYREKTPEDEQGIHPRPAPTKHPPYQLQLEDKPEIQPQYLQEQEES